VNNQGKELDAMLGLDYNEQVTNELRHIPLSFHHINEHHPFYRMPLHWHKPCEIVRVVQGTLTVFMDDDVVTVCVGEILFVNQEVVHGYEPANCLYEVIDFDPTILLLRTSFCQNSLHALANDKTRILPFHPTKNRDLCAIVNRLFALAAQNEERKELLLLSTLYELMGTIYAQHHYCDNAKIPSSATRFKPLLDFIDSSYMNPISSADMAKVSGMSQNYFTKVFTDYFGKTPIEFLNTYRIERACVLLINTNTPITDIACNTGFYDSSYFVKVFKKHKGMTPKKYRTQFTANI
jgi:AraC-like DNA-binding protein